MQTATENYSCDRQLTLQAPTGEPLVVQVEQLSLAEVDDALTACRLTLKVSSELYQRIDNEALFNLIPEVRHQTMEENFSPDRDIEIEICLSEDLFSDLVAQAYSAETAAQHLWQLNQTHHPSTTPLLFTENWYGLKVMQSIDLPPDLDGEIKIGYNTDWDDNSRNNEDDTDSIPDMINEEDTDSISEIAIAFFAEVQWLFKVEVSPLDGDESILHLMFQGDNGQWNCFACPREGQQQCAFYSVYPSLVPEESRMAIVEFLTRANFGMMIGNFEINLHTGEVRFKTSIDVEGDRLSIALFEQMVAANVHTMDRYFPGIEQVIEEKVLPEAAIAQLEG